MFCMARLFEFLRDKRFNAKAVFAPVGRDGKRLARELRSL